MDAASKLERGDHTEEGDIYSMAMTIYEVSLHQCEPG